MWCIGVYKDGKLKGYIRGVNQANGTYVVQNTKSYSKKYPTQDLAMGDIDLCAAHAVFKRESLIILPR